MQRRTSSPVRKRALRSATLCAIVAILTSVPIASQPRLDEYLPLEETYDAAIPKPSEVLGFEVGEWHVRPDLQVQYGQALAAASPRVRFEIQGRTHERRAQPLLIITSEANQARLDELLASRATLTDPRQGPAPDIETTPVVIWLGYSVHGNEASGANASLLTAYHFAASTSDTVRRQLDEMILLVDPSINPDGIGRFAHWVNMNRGARLIADGNHREHQEPWPRGRTNHYWFDLNRDWLLLQHPASRNRMATWKKWQPNLIGDFHEMGTSSTFFFQPGVPERKNPLIPDRNVELTHAIADFHADILDRESRLYYTQEGFDDFYPGKGSTYPDLNGSVGFLFEQASSRGHIQESANGDLTFPYGVKNQFLASLSMVKGGVHHRQDLVSYQRGFYEDALARDDATAAFAFQTPGDPQRAHAMVDLLRRHGIEVYTLNRDVTVGDTALSADRETSFIVPTQQPQRTLIHSLFDLATEFEDSTFYDVSAWTLPLAFDADFVALDGGSFTPELLGEAPSAERPQGNLEAAGTEPDVAFLFDWTSYYAPRALQRLLEAGVKVRAATKPFATMTATGSRTFERGTIVVPTGLDANDPDEILGLLAEATRLDGIDVYRTSTGLTPEGADLGSPSTPTIRAPRIVIVTGGLTSSYRVGELWHLLDHRFEVPVVLIDSDRLLHTDLSRYSQIVLADGSWSRWSEEDVETLKSWVRGGGSLIALQRSARWAGEKVLGREPSDDPDVADEVEDRSYADYPSQRAEQLLSGTVVGSTLDLTHPLAFGYTDPDLALFRTSTLVLEASSDPYENLAHYRSPPRLSGYISDENQDRLGGAVAAMATTFGGGTVIQLLDPPNFRSYFWGSNRLFLNALFFGQLIRPTSPPRDWLE